jgi:lipoprotein-anchoring transpeptidase ErfK/SrfK
VTGRPHARVRGATEGALVRVLGPTVPLTLALVCLGWLLAPAGAQAARAAAPIARYQDVVAVLARHIARSQPNLDGRQVASVSARRPIAGQRTVLPVIGQSIDNAGRSWLRVRLPGRTLGGTTPPPTGWILATNTRRSITPWHVVVDLRAREVIVYRDGRQLRTFRAIVGKPTTPTPHGLYFVEETVRLTPAQSGAPFALALSARSHVYQEFDGGPGQIAIHGLAHLGGRLGTASSHGCVRLAAGAIGWLAARIGAGVPVTIR